MRKILLLVIFTLVVLFIFQQRDKISVTGISTKSEVSIQKSIEETPQKSIRFSSPLLISPFGTGSYVEPNKDELIKKRKERMLRDGFSVPEKYFTMSVEELTNLGKAGDTSASIQLAERYWNEAAIMQSEVGVDFSETPRNIALRYFVMATQGGAGNIPEIVAKRLYESKDDVVNAAAWDMVAQRFSISDGMANSRSVRSFKGLTYEQINEANSHAAEIASQIGFVW